MSSWLRQSWRKICCYLSLLTEHLGTGGGWGHSSKCSGKITHSAEPHASRGAKRGRGEHASQVPPCDPQNIFSSALKTGACFKASVTEKLNTAKHHSEPSYHLASGCDDIKRGVRIAVGCLAVVPRSARRAIPWTAPAPAWDGRRVTAGDQRAVAFLQWQEGAASCKSHWVERANTVCDVAPRWSLAGRRKRCPHKPSWNYCWYKTRGWDCCGDDKPWQKYLWVWSCLKTRKLFCDQLVGLFKNMSRRVSYPSNILKLAGAIVTKRNL